MKFIFILLILLLSLGNAHSKTIFMSNFAATDNSSNSLEFPETDVSSSEDADISFQTSVIHTDAAGGSSTTKKSMRVDFTTGEARYITLLPQDVNLTQMSIGFAIHDEQDVSDTINSDILGIMMGGTLGCFVQKNFADDTLGLYYNTTGTSWGSTTLSLKKNACSTDTGAGCSSGSDCVSNTCSTCTNPTGAGCFWPEPELVQINYPAVTGDQVDCQLWWNGEAVLSGLKSAASLANITNARMGRLTAVASPLRYYVGNIVVDDTSRAGHGYVGSLFPNEDSLTNAAWTDNSCTNRSAGTDTNCIRDFTAGGDYSGTGTGDTLFASAANRIEDILFDDVTVGSTPISAVEFVLAGRGSGGTTTGQLSTTLLSCTSPTTCPSSKAKTARACTADYECGLTSGNSGDCSSNFCTDDFHLFPIDTPFIMARLMAETNAAGSKWSTATLTDLAMRVSDPVLPGGGARYRMGASVVYFRGKKADVATPSNLKDHNIGIKKCSTAADCCASGCACENGLCTKDGKKVVCNMSDSRGFGSLQTACPAGTNEGQTCSGAKYCNNVANAAGEIAKDIMCSTDATCATCTNKRSSANNGAGYPCQSTTECTPATLCPGVNCQCTGGFCTQNEAIQCFLNSDCEGLGTCETDPNPSTEGDYCVESCPGSACPERTGWPGFMSVNADAILSCSQGGQTLANAVSTRFEDMLVGHDTTCQFVVGTGRCQCTSNGACGAGGACWCQNDGDCGTGGSCNISTGACSAGSLIDGVCTAGDAAKIACTESTECDSSMACMPEGACDYANVLMDVNDAVDDNNPECHAASLSQHLPGDVCHGSTTVLCSDDTACDTDLGGSVSPTSECIGHLLVSDDYACGGTLGAGNILDGSQACTGTDCLCTANIGAVTFFPCKTDANCGSGKCLGTINSGQWYEGTCGCVSNAQCGDTAIWKCAPVDGTSTPGAAHPGRCRRKCTTSNDALILL
jgi:hypothetical protein